MKRLLALTSASLILSAAQAAGQSGDVFAKGEGIGLERAIPANERGILCLSADDKGRIYGGTTGRAAHLFRFDPRTNELRSLARLAGGVGFAYQLIRLPDGSLVGGTQADPTGIAVRTDPQAVGHLYRFMLKDEGPAKVEDLGVAVASQGIYTLAYIPKTKEIIGNTWPDGHLFTYDLEKRKFTDHGAIAGYRTFETPRHAEDINRGSGQKVRYARQVSRAIVVHNTYGAFTGGADGFLYRYDFSTRKVEKLVSRLPAAKGRESWASLDAAAIYYGQKGEGDFTSLLGGTADGHLFELHINDANPHILPRGKPLRQGTIQGLVVEPSTMTVYGVGGDVDGMPRSFRFNDGGMGRGMFPSGIPRVNGQPNMSGFGAMFVDKRGTIWAGERDRIGRLVRYRPNAEKPDKKKPPRPPAPSSVLPAGERPAALPCRIVFAPEGTTTDGSGYTAIEVGKDGRVYVGAARYGDYAWLLRFDPAAKPLFMDKVVNMRQLTGERRSGINTQGKIHAKIVVGADGRVWFASKQAHEIFDTRPEYGEDADGYPGGHLCYYDPKTGFSRSVGILKKQEGVVAGAIDDARGKLYYRSEPKNVFLVYDIAAGEVRERGHLGAACRYMAMDRHGAVYTVGRGATICRYDPKTDYVEDLAVKVSGEGGYDPPYVLAMGPNGKLYGLGVSHPSIMEFDIANIRNGPLLEVTMRNVAPASPPGYPVQDIHAAIFGKDGKLYYPLNTKGPLEKGGKEETHLRLIRFDPATAKVETVGIPQLEGFDEEKVKHVYTRSVKFRLFYMQGAAVGADGSLYLMGIYPQLHVACFPKLTAQR
jgi:sugar lactone lactonase YvrE